MEKCHTIAALCPGQRNRQDCWTGVLVVVESKLSVISVTLLEEEVRVPLSGRWVCGSSLALGLSVNDLEAPSDRYNTFSRHSYYINTGNKTIHFEV